MRTPEAARYIALSKSRLTQLRMTGEGPPFIKIAARAVAYRRSISTHGFRAAFVEQLLTK